MSQHSDLSMVSFKCKQNYKFSINVCNIFNMLILLFYSHLKMPLERSKCCAFFALTFITKSLSKTILIKILFAFYDQRQQCFVICYCLYKDIILNESKFEFFRLFKISDRNCYMHVQASIKRTNEVICVIIIFLKLLPNMYFIFDKGDSTIINIHVFN